LVFGETGVGKSSIINMLAGATIAATCNDAGACTFDNTRYELPINDYWVNVYDTISLNTPQHTKAPGPRAIAMLFKLIRALSGSDGIDFLVMTVRAPASPTGLTLKNYELFHKIFCQERVPVLFVVTGLEYENPMEGWWGRNRQVFEDYGMVFGAHACVTATKGKRLPSGGYPLQSEYDSSRETLRNAISSLCRRNEPWKEDADAWFQFTLGHLCKSLTAFFDVSQAGRQKLMTDALVEHAELGRRKAKIVKTGLA
jgi:energy-coupling factor transporter ATP-binding protein EcfA2